MYVFFHSCNFILFFKNIILVKPAVQYRHCFHSHNVNLIFVDSSNTCSSLTLPVDISNTLLT